MAPPPLRRCVLLLSTANIEVPLMAAFSAVLFFEDALGSYGWTEKYYVDAADHAAAMVIVDAMLPDRLGILLDNHNLIAARVSSEAVTGDSLFSTNPPLPGLVVPGAGDTLDPWSALNMRVEAGVLHRGRKFLHGIPEDTYLPNRNYDVANPNAAAFAAFAATISGTGFTLRTGNPGAYVYQDITACVYKRQTVHKVGRPFGLLVGRRPTTP